MMSPSPRLEVSSLASDYFWFSSADQFWPFCSVNISIFIT